MLIDELVKFITQAQQIYLKSNVGEEKGTVVFIETTLTIQTNVSFFFFFRERAEYNIELFEMTGLLYLTQTNA